MPRAGLAQGRAKRGSRGSRRDTWSPGWHSFPKCPGMLAHLVFCFVGLSRTGASWPGRGLRSPGWGASLRQLPLTESASSLLALKLSGFLSCPEGCEPELGKRGRRRGLDERPEDHQSVIQCQGRWTLVAVSQELLDISVNSLFFLNLHFKVKF